MHLYLRQALCDFPEIASRFLDVPRPGLLRLVTSLPIPGLARLDLDLQPLRYQLSQSLHVRRLLERLRGTFDMLHVYTHNAALLSVGLLRRVPTVVSLDATGTQYVYRVAYRYPTRWTPLAARAARFFERRVHHGATLVVAKSDWAARSLRSYGLRDEKIRVIPFGVTVPNEISRRPSHGLPQVTFIGRSMDRKGGWRLLDVYRGGLRGRCVVNLVTKDKVQPEPGVRVIRDINPGDGRLWDLLAESSLLVLPTDMDSFGVAVLEAMAAGVSVVTSRAGALPEIVDDGVTGILVEHDDLPGLTAAIRALLDDEPRRVRMGAAARARVQERYDVRLTTAQLIDVLHEARDLFSASRSAIEHL